MSIFLLISIGSVCAEDSAAVDASISSDDGSNIILSDDVLTDSGSNSTTQEKIPTTVESESKTISEKEKAQIQVNVKDNSSKNIDVTKSNINVNEGNKTLNFNYANSSITLSDKLSLGNHSIIIKYLGNDVYAPSNTTVTLKVFGDYTINATNVNVNSTNKAIIPIKITNGVDNINVNKNDLKLTLDYKTGNKTNTKEITNFEIVNGEIIITDFSMDNTTGQLTITYVNGSNNATKTITVNKIINAEITAVETTAEYASGEFKFKLVDTDLNKPIAGQSIQLTIMTGSINTGLSATTNDEGIASFNNANINLYTMDNNTISMKYHLPVGKQAVEVKPSASSTKATTLKTNLTITKATMNIKASNFKGNYGTKENFTITVTNKKTGEAMKNIILKLDMPQTSGKVYYIYTDANGTGKISVSGLVSGTYNVTISANETENINANPVTKTITINPQSAKITTKSVTMSYDTGNTASIKVTDKSGKALSGVYVLVQLYTGSNHKDYLFQTNSKGIIKFSAPLSVGKHKMVVSTADTRYKASSVTKYITVNKASAKISAPKVTTYYKSGKYLTVKVVNTKKSNKPIYDAKVTIKVFVSSNRYYAYNGNTGANGKLQLKIDLKPGTYKVVVEPGESKNYTAKQVSSKIVVKKAPTKLTPKKLTSKKGVSKKFQIKVTNKKTKKVIAGVKVKVKVYTGKTYKTYTLKTNSKGIAKLNVKSLKVGTHKVVVSSANKYCPASTAKSTIKITK